MLVLFCFFPHLCYNNLVMKYRFSVIIEKGQEGYFAYVPELQGCYTQGQTYEEVLGHLQDAISLHMQDRLENGEEIPNTEEKVVNFTNIEVTV